VHASVAFPIAIANQIAIPVGTIAEGQIVKVTKKAKQSHEPWVEIHFTRLIFTNGYTANINATDVSGFSPSSVVAPLTPTQTNAQAAAPPPPPKAKGFFRKNLYVQQQTIQTEDPHRRRLAISDDAL